MENVTREVTNGCVTEEQGGGYLEKIRVLGNGIREPGKCIGAGGGTRTAEYCAGADEEGRYWWDRLWVPGKSERLRRIWVLGEELGPQGKELGPVGKEGTGVGLACLSPGAQQGRGGTLGWKIYRWSCRVLLGFPSITTPLEAGEEGEGRRDEEVRKEWCWWW